MNAATTDRPLVLVADDDDDLRGAIADALREDEGFEVLEARDGAEALELALAEQPRALVLDHRMPGLTGAEVVTRLQAAGLHLPIILITAARDVRQMATTLGLRCFLGKPFGLEDLVAQIRQALSGGCC